MKIGPYDVCTSKGSLVRRSAARVWKCGVLLAEVFPGHGDALKWIRTRPLDDSRQEFIRQLQANDVPEDDIKMILQLPGKDLP